MLADETPITRTDGGLAIKFNYKWDKSASIYVNSIKDGIGRELLKEKFISGVEYTELDSESTPAAREGYSGGMLSIPLSNLKRRIEVGEILTTDIQFITIDGAATYFSLGEVEEPKRDIQLRMSYTWDEGLGILTAAVENVDRVAIVSLGCNISYTYHNKDYSIVPAVEEIDFGGTSYFYFYPPIGIPFDIHAKAEDANAVKDDTDILNAEVSAKGYRLNKANDLAIGAIA